MDANMMDMEDNSSAPTGILPGNGNLSFGFLSQSANHQNSKQLEVTLSAYDNFFQFIDHDAQTINVSGEPLECTIECDYKVINVSGCSHRLFIIGLCNQVNLTGDGHSVVFEGFRNLVNFNDGFKKASVTGNELSHSFGMVAGGSIVQDGPQPEKIPFPKNFKDAKRRRIAWRPVSNQ